MTEPTSQVRKNQILSVDAAEVEVADAGGYYAGANGEAVLQEVGADNAASIHDNVAGEINALTSKGLPVLDDTLLGEDSAASWAKKEFTFANISRLKDDRYLFDPTNGDHFYQYLNATPTGWTAVDAAASSYTNGWFSFWTLQGTSAERSYKYRKQSNITIESLPANEWRTFQWGPLYLRDGNYPHDILYTFGVYRDNAGVIDETCYIKTFIKWDLATLSWYTWGETSNGTATVTGSGYALSFPMIMPFYVRQVVRYDATKTTRSYIGTGYHNLTHSLLLNSNATATWGNVWWQIEMVRGLGAGVNDVVYLGSIDTYVAAG